MSKFQCVRCSCTLDLTASFEPLHLDLNQSVGQRPFILFYFFYNAVDQRPKTKPSQLLHMQALWKPFGVIALGLDLRCICQSLKTLESTEEDLEMMVLVQTLFKRGWTHCV